MAKVKLTSFPDDMKPFGQELARLEISEAEKDKKKVARRRMLSPEEVRLVNLVWELRAMGLSKKGEEELTGLPDTILRKIRSYSNKERPARVRIKSSVFDWIKRSPARRSHASTLAKLFQKGEAMEPSLEKAEEFIRVYKIYLAMYSDQEILIDPARFLSICEVIRGNEFEFRECKQCHTSYLAVGGSSDTTCPHCAMYSRTVCANPECGVKLTRDEYLRQTNRTVARELCFCAKCEVMFRGEHD